MVKMLLSAGPPCLLLLLGSAASGVRLEEEDQRDPLEIGESISVEQHFRIGPEGPRLAPLPPPPPPHLLHAELPYIEAAVRNDLPPPPPEHHPHLLHPPDVKVPLPPLHVPVYSSAPECAYDLRYGINATFCLVDEYYPVDTIKHELARNRPLLDRVLSDVAYQSADNLVDGLTKEEEESYSYSHYYGENIRQDIRSYHFNPEYHIRGGYICPSDIFYGRPKRATNVYGEWKVIVNLPEEYLAKGYGGEFARYSQTQRLEQCLYPSLPCSYIHPALPSACLQKYNFVRLLAFTPYEGLHMDSFKLPVACSCHITGDKYPHYG